MRPSYWAAEELEVVGVGHKSQCGGKARAPRPATAVSGALSYSFRQSVAQPRIHRDVTASLAALNLLNDLLVPKSRISARKVEGSQMALQNCLEASSVTLYERFEHSSPGFDVTPVQPVEYLRSQGA
jgi:hypothetical protein